MFNLPLSVVRFFIGYFHYLWNYRIMGWRTVSYEIGYIEETKDVAEFYADYAFKKSGKRPDIVPLSEMMFAENYDGPQDEPFFLVCICRKNRFGQLEIHMRAVGVEILVKP